MKRLLALLILAGCRRGEDAFPDAVADAYYPNGHPVALNTVDPRLVELEAELVDLTNERRAEKGLAPLRRSAMLDALARAHSAHMPQHNFYDHCNPEGEWPNDRLMRVARSGYITENLWWVFEHDSAAYMLAGFWGSPEHRANILSAANRIGVGMHRSPDPNPGFPDRIYVTMEFLRQ